jgi:hypothetical protein
MSALNKLAVLALLLIPGVALAQEGGDGGGSGGSLDLIRQLVVVVIPVLTPMIIAGVRRAASAIPPNILPILAPVIGVVLSALGNALNIPGLEGANLIEGAVLGSAGVGVREIANQNLNQKKKAA